MVKDEANEVKNTLSAKHHNIDYIHGAFVSSTGDIEKVFKLDPENLGEDVLKKLLSALKKPIGADGGDYTTIDLGAGASEQAKLLQQLRKAEMKDEDLFRALVEELASDGDISGGKDMLVFAVYNATDIKRKREDDLDDQSEEMFRYISVVVCPTKHGGMQYNFFKAEGKFRSVDIGWPISAPSLGILYPTFDNRGTNLDKAVLYAKKVQEHPSVIESLFGVDAGDYIVSAAEEELPEEDVTPAPKQMASIDRESEPEHHDVWERAVEDIAENYNTNGVDVVGALNKKAQELGLDSITDLDEDDMYDAVTEAGMSEGEADAMTEELAETLYSDNDGDEAASDYGGETATEEEKKPHKAAVSISVAEDARYVITQQMVDGKMCFVIRVEDVADINGVTL